MTRASLLHILHHVTRISAAEVRELEQLAAAFPYCQTAHLLLAKAAHDHGSMLAAQRLRHAATYAADRELLRRLIETPASPPETVVPAETASDNAPAKAMATALDPRPTSVVLAAPEVVGASAVAEAAQFPSTEPATQLAAPEAVAAPAPTEANAAPVEAIPAEAVVAPATAGEASPAIHPVAPDFTEEDTQLLLTPPALPAVAGDVPAVVEAATPEPAEETLPDAKEIITEPSVPLAETELALADAPEAAVATDAQSVPEPDGPLTLEEATTASSTEAAIEYAPPVTVDSVAEPVAESEPTAVEPAAETPIAAAEPVSSEQSAATSSAEAVVVAVPESATLLLPDDLPALAPPIRQPADRGSSRFEYGFEHRPAAPQPVLYQLPDDEDDAPTSPAVPAFYTDDTLGYAQPGGSRLGYALTAADLAAGPLPFETFFEPDALLVAHAAAHQPAPLPTSIDLINRFLKNKPRLKSPAALPQPTNEQQDLSVRSTSIVPELASESLAKILVKQGKVAKAIEIYERLMVRQPEKKAYFADQIQHLKPTE